MAVRHEKAQPFRRSLPGALKGRNSRAQGETLGQGRYISAKRVRGSLQGQAAPPRSRDGVDSPYLPA
jgi:hypothetical protein